MISGIWLATAVIVVLSAVIQGTTGFGFALIAVPPLTLIYGPRLAIGMGMVLSTLSMLWMWARSHHERTVSITGRLYIGAIIGLPLGFWVLNSLSIAILRIFVGVVTIALAGGVWFVVARRSKSASVAEFPTGSWSRAIGVTGFVSGFLMGCLGMAGPPVIALMSGSGLPKSVARAAMVEFFALIYVTAIAGAFLSGTISTPLVLQCVAFVPALLIGIGAGNLVHRASSQKLYTMATLVLIAIAGISCLWSGVAALAH